MDPNAALRELLELAQCLPDRVTEVDAHDDPGSLDYDGVLDPLLVDVNRVVELIGALDWWMQSGGFLPDRWARVERTRRPAS